MAPTNSATTCQQIEIKSLSFKPSKDAERLALSIEKKLGNFGFEFFVGDVIMKVGLRLFGPLHLAMGPNRKRAFCFFKKTRRKAASFQHLIARLAFAVGKLCAENHKINI